jgi:uncharacterized protein
MHSALYTGRVSHCRREPRRHEFSYATSMLWLDLAELDTVFERRWLWSTRRANLACFRRQDYLGDPDQPLDTAVRDCVARAVGARPAGPIRLLTLLRLYGLSFNPVSFYYCYDEHDRHVEAIVAEITNTPWKQRHRYVVTAAPGARRQGALRGQFDKCFHVSPFMPMDLRYEWAFTEPGEELGVAMTNRVQRLAAAHARADHGPAAGGAAAERARLRRRRAGAHLLAGAAPVVAPHAVSRAPRGLVQSSAVWLISMPSERSLRYRCVRSMPTRLASNPTLPPHSCSCCCR